MNFADGIPWAIAVIGWGATHVFSEARERRKEYRGQIDKLHERLLKIEEDARAFHCAEAYDDVKAGDLLSKLALLERLMMRVPIFAVDDLHPHIISLRRAVTLNNFDKSSFTKQPIFSEIGEGITAAVQDMEDELERQYRVHYTHQFPYIKLQPQNFLGARPN